MLHAANQDLPCLAEIGLVPKRIFDTELAARLAGLPRVGLGAVVESLLGFSLQKGHSAADWSTRPLPEEWLVYAALDVEVLVDLRDALAAILEEQGKTDWARQEFEAILAAGPPAPKTDPWRRTSGVHGLRSRRQLGMLRALWQARDDMARKRDIAPGRVLPDSAMVSAVQADPVNEGALLELPVFRGRANRRLDRHLVRRDRPRPRRPRERTAAAQQAGRGAAAGQPVGRPRSRGGDPAAGRPCGAGRDLGEALGPGGEHPLPRPGPPDHVEPAGAAGRRDGRPTPLRAGGAREWQIELTVAVLADAVTKA